MNFDLPPEPMLAETGKVSDVAGAVERGYIIEPKIDGIRCIAVVDRDNVTLYNRQLRSITAAFPDVCTELRQQAAHLRQNIWPFTMDGEIYVLGHDGQQADFQLVQHRANRKLDVDTAAREYPARFTAFDMLRAGNTDYVNDTLRAYPLRMRKYILRTYMPNITIETLTQEQADAAVAEGKGEGLMLKWAASVYMPGTRSPSWRKIKWLREVEAVVGGVTWGYGKREDTFGGLLVGVFKPEDREGVGRLTYIGCVGTGFNDATLESLTTHLMNLRVEHNPFVTRPTDWDVQFFVRPVMKVKVRFANYTREGIMRFPRYVGLA